MPDIYLILDLLVVIALIGLALTVLLKDTSVHLNRIFAVFVVCISVWIVANYISNDIDFSARTAVIANYFVFSFSYGASVFLLRFGVALADDVWFRKVLRPIYPGLLLIALSGASPLVVSGAHLQD